MAWENAIGTITGFNGSTSGLTTPGNMANQTPIGYTITVDYTVFDILNAEALAGIEFGMPMLNPDIGTIPLTDGNIQWDGSGYIIHQSNAAGNTVLVSGSANDSWFDKYNVYIVCGYDKDAEIGRVGILYPPRDDPPQQGWAEWQISWSAISNSAYKWIDHNVIPIIKPYTSNGGGATHIAKVTGQLSSLSNNLSDILIVSGGGGGGMLIDDTIYAGKDAGGIAGNGTNSADQTSGYAFGQGESSSNVSGGGGGLYGGYKGIVV